MQPRIATHRSIHPLNIIAGVAVVLFCGVAMAGIMGWLPDSTGATVQVIDNPRLAMSERLTGKKTEATASGWCKHCGNVESTRNLTTGTTEVRVLLDDGTLRTFRQPKPQWRTGERVNIVRGELVAAKEGG